MPEQNWSLRGEYMESCNCDYLCPCVYTNPQGPATYDNCMAVLVFRIDEGRSGTTDLAGLTRRVAIPELVSFEIEGVASRNGAGEPYYLDNVGHPAGRRLALARSKETRVNAFGIDLDLAGQGNNGHFAPFSWTG